MNFSIEYIETKKKQKTIFYGTFSFLISLGNELFFCLQATHSPEMSFFVL